MTDSGSAEGLHSGSKFTPFSCSIGQKGLSHFSESLFVKFLFLLLSHEVV